LGVNLAKRGFPVILDAKYDRQGFRTEAIIRAEKHQLPIRIIQCTAPEAVLRDRLLSRTNDVSDATADLLTQQQATAERFTHTEQPLVTSVDTTQDWVAQLESTQVVKSSS
jgi:predicted kinase